jgi:hypothetical protein
MARDVTEQGFQKAASRAGFGSRMVGVNSLPTPDEVGEVSNASDIGATRRKGSSSPSPANSSGAKSSDNPSILPAARTDGP